MKPILILLFFIFSFTNASAALLAPVDVPVIAENKPKSLDREAVEAHLGRKLNFAERIVFGVAKRKARRQALRGERSGPVDALAVVSFGLGLASIFATLLGSGALLLLFGLGGIVTGIISLVNLAGKRDYKRGRGFAIAGIAVPIGWVVLILLYILVAFN